MVNIVEDAESVVSTDSALTGSVVSMTDNDVAVLADADAALACRVKCRASDDLRKVCRRGFACRKGLKCPFSHAHMPCCRYENPPGKLCRGWAWVRLRGDKKVKGSFKKGGRPNTKLYRRRRCCFAHVIDFPSLAAFNGARDAMKVKATATK